MFKDNVVHELTVFRPGFLVFYDRIRISVKYKSYDNETWGGRWNV